MPSATRCGSTPTSRRSWRFSASTTPGDGKDKHERECHGSIAITSALRPMSDRQTAAIPGRPAWAVPVPRHFSWLEPGPAAFIAPDAPARTRLEPHPSLKRPLFWLHIKKSAGTSMRRMLQPFWFDIDSFDVLPGFLQVNPVYWNTLLNNPRTPLGDYGARRGLFASTFLYSNWEQMFSFAVARNPTDRVVSMFFYKYVTPFHSSWLRRRLRFSGSPFSLDRLFDRFLGIVEEVHASPSAFLRNTDFAAHTAPMSPDVVDDGGRLLMTRIVRFETMLPSLQAIVEECGGDPSRVTHAHEQKGRSRRSSRPFQPSTRQIEAITRIFGGDFELYESAWRP